MKMRKVMAMGMAAVMLCGVLAGCGGKEAPKEPAPKQDVSSTVTSEASEVASVVDDSERIEDGKFKSVEDFLNSNTVSPMIDELEKMGGDTMDVSVEGEGDTMILRFTMSAETIADDSIKETLTAQFQELLDGEMKAQADNLLEQLVKGVTVKDPAVKIVFDVDDGTVIAEKEYKPEG